MQSSIETSQPTNKIFYWNGILDPLGLGSVYSDIIEKIVAGNYAGLDFEKLIGHDVFSVRINKSDRLLFNEVIVNNMPYLMLLDVVLNHDYAKSRFLKPAVLKNYMELHGQAISEHIVQQHFATHQMHDRPLKQSRTCDYSRIDFYNQKFIELDTTQLDVATKVSLPLIITGAAGSGKSCIALLILSQYIESNIDIEFPILYVTESENLATSMQRAWSSLPIAQNLDTNAVQFKSYQQLIMELANVDNMVFVSKEHCLDYIKQYAKTSLSLKKKNFSDSLFEDIDAIYQEFRIMSGYMNYPTYNQLGRKQSLFNNDIDKEFLFTAFNSYQLHLKSKKAVHAPFYLLEAKNKFKRIVVDEAQDFSHGQLELLGNLACNKQICFCEDTRQSLLDNKSKIPFLKGLFYSWGKKENLVTLSTSYRCPEAVIKLANAVSELKSIVTDHGQQDIIAPITRADKGKVKWFSSLADEELASLQEEASSPDFAIITSKEYKEEAKKLFKTMLVFTADEIKGLEYKKILAWCPFDDPLFKEANTLIAQSTGVTKKAGHRAKQDQGHEQFGPPFSAVYTAFTRATDTLYIVQKKHHYLECITSKLIDTINMEQQAITLEMPEPAKKDQSNEWFAQAKLQLNMGNIDIAKTIFLERLNKTAEEFEEFKTFFLKAEHQTIRDNTIDTKRTALSSNDNSIVVKSTPRNAPVKAKPIQNQPKTDTRAQGKTPEPLKPVKIPNEIVRLLKNLNESNLFTILKHKSAVNLLFNVPIAEGACLFTHLFSINGGQELLYKCIRTSSNKIQISLAKGITMDALCRPNRLQCSPLYWLATDAGIGIFQQLITNNPEILNLITAEALCLPHTIKGADANTSPLYFLSSKIAGIKVLNALFLQNPNLVKSISLKTICLPMTSQAGEYVNISALFRFGYTPGGLEVINMLLDNIELDPEILGHALCLPTIAGVDCHVSPLYLFAATAQGQTMLLKLLNREPTLAKYITSEALCLTRKPGGRTRINVSPLYLLSTQEKGQEVFLKLITLNPELAISINTIALFHIPQAENTSAVNWLLSSTIGKEILFYLSMSKPELTNILKEANYQFSSPVKMGMFAQTNTPSESPKNNGSNLTFDMPK